MGLAELTECELTEKLIDPNIDWPKSQLTEKWFYVLYPLGLGWVGLG